MDLVLDTGNHVLTGLMKYEGIVRTAAYPRTAHNASSRGNSAGYQSLAHRYGGQEGSRLIFSVYFTSCNQGATTGETIPCNTARLNMG